ncbi:MAG TPA: glycosyltransferase family 4 protein [Steroidobacteraceae bacterium]|nr:glycosyltransferase family 4 protein [Steroidobacteraceae bacterium]
MSGLRLLVVSSDTYPPTRVDVAVLFARELVGRGHRIDWILQSEAACGHAYETPWGGGTAYVGATDLGDALWRRIRKHLLGLKNDLKVLSLPAREHYDVIQVKDKFLAGVLALIARRRFRCRFIYWLSYPFPESYLLRARDGTARYPWLYRVRGTVFKWLLYRWLLPAADHVFVQSEQMRADIAAEGIALDKMTAVPMGVAEELATPCAARGVREVLPAGVPCVLYLGTLIQVRRLDFLIRAFARVHARLPQARLYLVGRGVEAEDEAFLRRAVAELRLEASVIFVGELPQARALEYVREADVCASPFHPTPILRSTSPTKLVEYLALGKAVVANDHPEQRRVLEESGGGLCVPYEEQAFANALVRLLEDPALARAMGERGRRYVLEHRSYRVIADAVERRLIACAEAPA